MALLPEINKYDSGRESESEKRVKEYQENKGVLANFFRPPVKV